MGVENRVAVWLAVALPSSACWLCPSLASCAHFFHGFSGASSLAPSLLLLLLLLFCRGSRAVGRVAVYPRDASMAVCLAQTRCAPPRFPTRSQIVEREIDRGREEEERAGKCEREKPIPLFPSEAGGTGITESNTAKTGCMWDSLLHHNCLTCSGQEPFLYFPDLEPDTSLPEIITNYIIWFYNALKNTTVRRTRRKTSLRWWPC